MPRDQRSERICRCQHPHAAHLHYTPGAACSLCEECQRYRSARSLLARLIALLPPARRPPGTS